MDIGAIDNAFQQSPLIQDLASVFESGDFGRFDADAKRQHFVPRFLQPLTQRSSRSCYHFRYHPVLSESLAQALAPLQGIR